MAAIPIHRVRWDPTFRLISPPRYLLGAKGSPARRTNLRALLALRDPYRRGPTLPPALLRTRGWDVIYAPFVVSGRYASRFSNGSYGAWYGARALTTAIAETRHHRQTLLKQYGTPPTTLRLSAFSVALDGLLHDIRGSRDKFRAAYAPDDYRASQRFGATLYRDGSRGIAYDSVRQGGGECCCIFRPDVLSRCRWVGEFLYRWDGRSIDAVYQKM